MISKSDLVILIDAYAAAKVSGNEYLIIKVIDELQQTVDQLYSVINSTQEKIERTSEVENDG